MGFFDKLKQAGRALTGGAAKVHVELPGDISVSEPFTVKVTATVDDADLEIDAVYLLVRAVEQIEIDREQLDDERHGRIETMDDDFGHDSSDVATGPSTYRGEEETCDLRINIAGADKLEAEQTYHWEGEVKLPVGALPSYTGRNARHVWMIQAGLDAFGNDPDSGWIEFDVR